MAPDRAAISFAQAEGAEPLPQQMQLKKVSPELTAKVWRVVHDFLKSNTEYPTMGGSAYYRDELARLQKDWHVEKLYRLADEFTNNTSDIQPLVKKHVTSKTTFKSSSLFSF